MSTRNTPMYRIFAITAEGDETPCGRFRSLPRAQKTLDELDFALFSLRDAGVSDGVIGYRIVTQAPMVGKDAL